MIVVVSDLHLGYENAEKDAFLEFLDEDKRWKDVTDFVILGDFVDMWRRDASGVFLEQQDVMSKLLELQARKVAVHIVAGNHDYHLLQLKKKRGYPFAFEKDLMLGKYRFVHGYEYDEGQKPIFMEALCRLMNDSVGGNLSLLWKLIQSGSGYLVKYRLPQGFGETRTIKALSSLTQRPELRLKDTIQDVEKRAARSLRKGEVLIFGHTHIPFVNKKETIVNTGSWVKEKEDRPHNTFVEIAAGKISLQIFKKGDITERIDL